MESSLTNINSLPFDVLLKIYEYLDTRQSRSYFFSCFKGLRNLIYNYKNIRVKLSHVTTKTIVSKTVHKLSHKNIIKFVHGHITLEPNRVIKLYSCSDMIIYKFYDHLRRRVRLEIHHTIHGLLYCERYNPYNMELIESIYNIPETYLHHEYVIFLRWKGGRLHGECIGIFESTFTKTFIYTTCIFNYVHGFLQVKAPTNIIRQMPKLIGIERCKANTLRTGSRCSRFTKGDFCSQHQSMIESKPPSKIIILNCEYSCKSKEEYK